MASFVTGSGQKSSFWEGTEQGRKGKYLSGYRSTNNLKTGGKPKEDRTEAAAGKPSGIGETVRGCTF